MTTWLHICCVYIFMCISYFSKYSCISPTTKKKERKTIVSCDKFFLSPLPRLVRSRAQPTLPPRIVRSVIKETPRRSLFRSAPGRTKIPSAPGSPTQRSRLRSSPRGLGVPMEAALHPSGSHPAPPRRCPLLRQHCPTTVPGVRQAGRIRTRDAIGI
jgi:hypothetical protein